MFIDLKILENMINSVNMNKDTKSNLFTWDHFYRSCKHLIYCPNLVHFHNCMSSFFSFSFFHRSYTEFTNHRLTLNEFLNKSTHRFLCCSFGLKASNKFSCIRSVSFRVKHITFAKVIFFTSSCCSAEN